jgi:glutathione S-transferase
MELHSGFGPLFNPATPDEAKAAAKTRLAAACKWVDGELAGKQYLMGDPSPWPTATCSPSPTGPSPVGWTSRLANLLAYRERVGARPAVQAAMKAEGLIK